MITLHKLPLAMLLASLALPVFAEDAHHPDQKAQAAKPADMSPDKALDTMQGNVKKMQVQLEKIRATQDTVARSQLMHEHMQTMRENMTLGMHSAGCPMMGEGGMKGMGGGMMDGGMMGKGMMMGGNMAADPMAARIERMEKRMEMMQNRLDQLKKAQPASGK